MNELVDYKAPKPNPIVKFLWNCAGADHEILKYSSYSDHVKYAGIGGVVLATGVLAALSMGFAIHTIFENWVATIIVAIIWSLIIFNLDRFIVSSTGKGDGIDSISWGELKNALPRILIAVLLGLTISAPLETYIFQKEIQREWQLSMDQLAISKSFEVEQTELQRDSQIISEVRILEKECNEQQLVYEKAKELFNGEMDGGAGARGYGREAKIKEDKMKEEQSKLKTIESKRDSLRFILSSNEKGIKEKKDSTMNQIKTIKPGFLDQLMMIERLSTQGKSVPEFDPATKKIVKGQKIEIYGNAFWPIWLVRILFIIIEIAPVFLKLMLIKSPYDYMSENVNQILEAKQGISIEHVKDENNKITKVKDNYNPKRIIEVVKVQNELEAENAKLAMKLYAEQEQEKIKKDPSEFIKPDDKI
jgi:hypothetical protein